jgi:hypothetical protein
VEPRVNAKRRYKDGQNGCVENTSVVDIEA